MGRARHLRGIRFSPCFDGNRARKVRAARYRRRGGRVACDNLIGAGNCPESERTSLRRSPWAKSLAAPAGPRPNIQRENREARREARATIRTMLPKPFSWERADARA